MGGTLGASAIAEAEARRETGDWAGAAAAYARHLAAHPDDWAIWVQHGHCVKEAGNPEGAIVSYHRAKAGLPQDADLHLQIGHALKRAGNLAGARAAYAQALELDPAADSAWRELTNLPPAPASDAEDHSRPGDLCVVFDLSDLMSWFDGARAPTGIQRVQMEVASAALRMARPGTDLRCAVFDPQAGAWRQIPREAFRRLCGLSQTGTDTSDPAWTTSLAEVRALLAAAPGMAFPQAAWLVNLGSSWWLAGYHQAVRAARGRSGLRYAAMVHDTGPVTLPEHSPPQTSAHFARWFSVLVQDADLLLTPSEAAQRDIETVAATTLPGLRCAPVRVLRPGLNPPLRLAAAVTTPTRITELAGEPFVLFLGTIESRKDHLFVLNAWLALLRRHGAAVPRLVLAGRAGFDAEPALDLLRRAPALQERAAWLGAVTDAEAAALLHGALFCVYHSRLEGWGLPVTEALAAGKAVVTPGHSGLLEAGQGLALHHAASSEPDFLAQIERLLFAPDALAQAEARIAAGFRHRGWTETATELLDLLAAGPADPPPPPPAPPLGRVHTLGEIASARPTAAMAWAEWLRDGTNWHAPEPWGCWTRPGRALLRLPLPAQEAGPLRLHLALRGAAADREVTLRAGRGERIAIEVPAGSRPVAVLDLPPGTPLAEIAIETAPRDAGGDAAPDIGIGVAAAMVCAPDDILARLGFLERLSFVFPEPA